MTRARKTASIYLIAHGQLGDLGIAEVGAQFRLERRVY